ncbi:MAG: efflux RND transporter permease subunit [Rubrivivax sp.]|nr:efflux RND transporter permease subunit [Rubrivivax sp.]MCW5635203.1 efflux RND transporter permease subunit [Rubrivivax sp.]
MALLGLTGLAGIPMRNALILTQQVSDNFEAGMGPFEGVVEAAVQRGRPVMPTALAAVLAFVLLTQDSCWGAAGLRADRRCRGGHAGHGAGRAGAVCPVVPGPAGCGGVERPSCGDSKAQERSAEIRARVDKRTLGSFTIHNFP